MKKHTASPVSRRLLARGGFGRRDARARQATRLKEAHSKHQTSSERSTHMRLTRTASLLMFTFLFALPAVAQKQTVEYGAAGELRGVKKVFVDTGTDVELRNRIVEEIHKRLPDLDVVSTPEAAEVHLQFSLKEERDYGLVIPAGGRVGVTYSVGVGSVVRVLGENRVRVLLSFKDSRTRFGERRPSTNFARAFVEAYRQANK